MSTPPVRVGALLPTPTDMTELQQSEPRPIRLLPPAPEPSVDEQHRRLLARSGVPSRFLDRRFDTFTARPGTRKALEAAQGVATLPPDRGLLLLGGVGSGKTHLEVAVLAEILRLHLERHPRPVVEDVERNTAYLRNDPMLRFVVVPSLLDDLRARVHYSDGDDPLIELRQADLLVLDDLGREKATDWVHERLYVLVNDRYNARRPTIVSTNYALDELADRGYDAVMSRLSEQGRRIVIEASDHRLGMAG